MHLGENYYAFNPDENQQPSVNLFQRAWRAVLAVTQTWTHGDDLSHWNTITNWFLKQTEMKFSVLKLGEGGDPNPDSKLWEFAADAKASGTIVMVYWFFRSNVLGETQLAYALALLEQLTAFLGYKPFFWADVETSDNVANATRLTRLKVLLDGVEAWNPGKVGIYTSPGFANTKLTPMPAWINTFKHWIAHWTGAALPTQPTGWLASMCFIWQIGYWLNPAFPWCLEVPGAEPNVDRNKFYGDEAACIAFSGYVEPPPPVEDYVTHAELDAAVAELTALVFPPFTHVVTTTAPNGVKLTATPDSGEAVMLPNGNLILQLKLAPWKDKHLYAALVGGTWVSGWLTDDQVIKL